MTTQNEILQSNESEMILESETFQKALNALKDEYINLWINSHSEEEDLREKLHLAVKLLPEVEKHLRIIIERGKITKATLSRIRKIV